MSRSRRSRKSSASTREGTFWGPVAYLMAGLASILLFVAALPQEPATATPDDGREEEIRVLVAEQALLTREWRNAISSLCSDPVLQAEGIAPDCTSGSVTFGDDLFDESLDAQLTEEGIRKLHIAIDRMLRSLRADELVWQNVESIELRGHADPRARRDPYVTNMQVSQKRPMSLMFYLISDWALSDRDRSDLQRLLVLSAASHSRPPASCPERSRECYPYWRRVEITPRLKDAQLMSRLDRLVDDLQDVLAEAP